MLPSPLRIRPSTEHTTSMAMLTPSPESVASRSLMHTSHHHGLCFWGTDQRRGCQVWSRQAHPMLECHWPVAHRTPLCCRGYSPPRRLQRRGRCMASVSRQSGGWASARTCPLSPAPRAAGQPCLEMGLCRGDWGKRRALGPLLQADGCPHSKGRPGRRHARGWGEPPRGDTGRTRRLHARGGGLGRTGPADALRRPGGVPTVHALLWAGSALSQDRPTSAQKNSSRADRLARLLGGKRQAL